MRLPSGVTPSVSGVMALGKASQRRHSMDLPLPLGRGRWEPNWVWTRFGRPSSSSSVR